MNLSILICTVILRQNKLETLLKSIDEQISSLQNKIEVCIFQDDFQYTIGKKRNCLLRASKGKFIVFVDDDDEIHINYCKRINEIIENKKKINYIGYRMSRIFDGIEQPHEYKSIHFKNLFRACDGVTYRSVSHTNPILSDIAKRFQFLEYNSGEDSDWCEQIHKSDLLKTEHFINESMYIQRYEKNESLSKTAKDSEEKIAFAKPPTKIQPVVMNYKWIRWIKL